SRGRSTCDRRWSGGAELELQEDGRRQPLLWLESARVAIRRGMRLPLRRALVVRPVSGDRQRGHVVRAEIEYALRMARHIGSFGRDKTPSRSWGRFRFFHRQVSREGFEYIANIRRLGSRRTAESWFDR